MGTSYRQARYIMRIRGTSEVVDMVGYDVNRNETHALESEGLRRLIGCLCIESAVGDRATRRDVLRQ